MSAYNMPPDTSAREKLVGGILDLTQLLFLLAGLAVGFIIGWPLKSAMGMPGLVIGLVPGLAVGLIFAFLQIKGLSLLSYIRYKKLHKKKTKKLPNVRLDGLSKEDISKIRNF